MQLFLLLCIRLLFMLISFIEARQQVLPPLLELPIEIKFLHMLTIHLYLRAEKLQR
jgi:hypothetical protein